ncbi:MAG: chromosomal replication initiator protein DnaA [Oscillospiraceae bacterium]|nr:chromosomal replication initiator protein DnaA [Oscillospiraceae bacterium]
MVDLNASKDLSDTTDKIKEHIKKNIADKPRIYDLWFASMSVLRMTDSVVFISVDTEMQQKTIEVKYKHLIEEAVKQLYDCDGKVIIYNTQYGKITREQIDADEIKFTPGDVIEADNDGDNRLILYSKNRGLKTADNTVTEDEEGAISEFIISNNTTKFKGSLGDWKKNFKLDYTFDNFVVGSSNRLAYTACTVVAQYPADKYNPLFIHGPSGIGKTHLLYAISNEYVQRFQNTRIIYITGEEFTNQVINNLSEPNFQQKNQYMQNFRENYRNCDMLLIDDIQFIAGKNTTQEEFFHTFNALYNGGKQIILTSDRPPRDIKILEDRLKSRFESGLIADIQSPDFELRVAILKRKSEDMGIKISNEVLLFLAENISSSIRQLEGAIKKLNAYAYLNNLNSSGITLELAKACIADILSGTEPINVTVEKILSLVAQTFGVPLDELKGRKRTKEVALARNVAIYIIRKITDLSLPATGRFFDRDHSTIHSAVTTIAEEVKTNNTLNNQIEEISKLAKS